LSPAEVAWRKCLKDTDDKLTAHINEHFGPRVDPFQREIWTSISSLAKPSFNSIVSKGDMDEHQFPLDLDAGLRREVKLQVERETKDRDLKRTKRHFVKLTLRSLVSTAVAITLYILFFPKPSWIGVFRYSHRVFRILEFQDYPRNHIRVERFESRQEATTELGRGDKGVPGNQR
jgi:hypothetical protein